MASKLNHFLVLTAFFSLSLAHSQFEYGVKAGLNYNSLGDIDYQNLSATSILSEPKAGYHFGFYGSLNVLFLYLRPEIQFTKSNSSFNSINVITDKIEAPIVLGYNFLGPLSVFAGPNFQYVLKEDIEKIDFTEIQNNFTVGLQVGIRFKLKAIGISFRYNRSLSANEISILDQNKLNIGKINPSSKEFIISASYKIK